MKKAFKHFIVDKNYKSTRLDRFLKKQDQNLPQSLIEKNIRKKKILINKLKGKSSQILQEGDLVEVFFENNLKETKQKINTNKKFNTKDLEYIKKCIIFENQDYIILNKPYGYASQDGTKVKKNLIDILNSQGSTNYHLVHRLDMETVGIMVLAKNREYAKIFSDIFQSRSIVKKYYAITKGKINKNSGEIVTKEDVGKKKIVSKTFFEVKAKNKNFSFLELEILTGRKHQIRKQLSEIGHPVVGDHKYGEGFNEMQLCLCSFYLEFEYKGKLVKYSIKLPKFMENFIQKYLYTF